LQVGGRGERGERGEVMTGLEEGRVSLGQPGRERREGEAQASMMRAMEEEAWGLCSSLRRRIGGWGGEAARRARIGAGVEAREEREGEEERDADMT
jgi:hypothetical protein